MTPKDGKNGRKNQESPKMIVKFTLVVYLHNLNKPRKLLYFFKKEIFLLFKRMFILNC